MLTHLTIRNFAVVKHIELDLSAGLTAITGETGAGKSIGIDALVLCTGGRADASMVRTGAAKAEIVAHFDIQLNQRAKEWLGEYELSSEEECFIRRVISAEGRSKAFINGSPVALQQLKQLGAILLNIHGQNDHQQLLKEATQRDMLDSFANHPHLVEKVANNYAEYQQAKRQLEQLQQSAQAREDRKHLLSYQVSELDEFGLGEQEFVELEVEHKRLSNSQSLLEQSQLSYHRLYDDEQFNAMSAIQQSIDNLSSLCDSDPQLQPIVSLLSEASIQVEEAAQELRSYCDDLDIDPMRMQQVEQRYDKVNELARKHQVLPEVLYAHHMRLVSELSNIEAANDELNDMQQQLEKLKADYDCSAEKLSASRQKAAKTLAKKLEQKIQRMNMPHATIDYQVLGDCGKASAHGIDSVNITISTNLGQQADSLGKVVSGGELARVGLAMQVLTADQSLPPTMIFDEVDTGISGPTASIVGQLLRQMGEQAQVMCVTHLPQVAAQAHNQLFVTKQIVQQNTETHIVHLENEQRVNELARLLAGDSITDSAISNARSLLKNVA